MDSWITEDGTFGDVESAPEGVRELIESKKWSGIGDMAKSYREMEDYNAKVKRGGLQLPETLTDDDMALISSKLGRPETPDKYEFNLPDGVELNDDILGKFKTFAHGLNLTAKQADALLNFELDVSNSMRESMEAGIVESRKKAAETLKGEWKENYDKNFKAAKETAENLKILDTLEGLGLADNPTVIKMCHDLSEKLGEDVIKKPPEAASASKDERIKEISKSEEFRNMGHPDHKKVMKEFMELHGISD